MSEMPMLALTGANGYVGALIARALAENFRVVGLARRPGEGQKPWSLAMSQEDSRAVLAGCDCLVHAAWDMKASDPEKLERECVEGSRRLFAAARDAGVKNLVFISTISAFDGARSAYGKAKLRVERMALEQGGTVLRLGLVCGEGGMLGSLRAMTGKARVIPLIGDGSAPQYLLGENRLKAAVLRAAQGEFASFGAPITLADPNPVAFADLLRKLAAEQGAKPILVPIPWRLIHAGLRGAELSGLKLNVRSDSVISFVFQNPAPDFSALGQLSIDAGFAGFAT